MDFVAVVILVLSAVERSASQSQNCAQSCDLFKNYCYICGPEVDNPTSQSFCTSVGGQLPFFQSQADLADYNAYKTSKLGGASSWLGYWNYNSHSASNPGVWRDANGTGSSSSFTVWSTGEPNDWGSGEECAQTVDGSVWNDISCSGSFSAICMCRCPTIVQIANGRTANAVFPVINAVTSFSCNSGYRLVRPSSTSCIYNGIGIEWSAASPICERMKCTDWFNTTFGSVQSAPYYAGLNYNYTCNTNFVLNAGANILATYNCDLNNGVWVQSAFISCEATCVKVNNISFGSVSSNWDIVFMIGRKKLGSISNFTCNSGYYLVGNSTLFCTANGNWSDAIPFCKPIPIEGIWWLWPFVVGFLSFICLCCHLWICMCKRKKKRERQIAEGKDNSLKPTAASNSVPICKQQVNDYVKCPERF